nr:MFS transporter [Flexivirga meconopsidis]
MIWVGAAAISTLGTGVLEFGIVWYATGLSTNLAGVVTTVVVAPRIALLLVGGLTADRLGIRRVLVAGDLAMLVMCVALAVWTSLDGVQAALLVAVSVLAGVVDAFYLPVTGVLPRLFVDGAGLPRALAVNSTFAQLARLAGPALGAVVVVALGLTGAAVIDAVSFTIVLTALVMIRPPLRAASATPERVALRRTMRDVWDDQTLRRTLVATAVIAAVVLPAVTLGTPLLAPENSWGATVSGLLEAGWIVGGLPVTAVIARWGVWRRQLLAVTAGLLAQAVGLTGLGLATSPWAAGIGAVLLGVGVAVCTGHLWPAYLAATPPGQLARYQAILVLAQMLPLVVTTFVFASSVESVGAPTAFIGAGVVLLVTAIWWLAKSGMRPVGWTRHTGLRCAKRAARDRVG